MDHEPDDASAEYSDPREGYRGPSSFGDLCRSAARKLSDKVEDFEAPDPENEYRGPASLGDMLGLGLKIAAGALMLFLILGFGAMLCGSGTCRF